MTVTIQTNRTQAEGDDATKTFNFSFRVYATGDIVVYSTTGTTDTLQVLDTDYSATVNATTASPGGSIVFVTAPATGATITIYRDLSMTQGTSFTVGGPFPAKAHEQALDRAMLKIQDLEEQILRRAPTYGVTSSGTGNY